MSSTDPIGPKFIDNPLSVPSEVQTAASNAPPANEELKGVVKEHIHPQPAPSVHPDFKATVMKEAGKLWNLQIKVLKFASKIFSAAGTKRKEMKHQKLEEAQTLHQKRMNISKEQKETHLEYAKSDVLPTGQGLKIPFEFVKEGAMIVDAKNLGHKTAAMLAARDGSLPIVEDLRSPGLGSPIEAFSFVPTKVSELGKGSVTPTSHFEGKVGGADHLVNAYVMMVEGKNYGVIRTGMITTEQYADDFAALINHVISKLPPDLQDKPIRIVSQQLNSPENEGSLIDAQHRWIIHANSKLPASAQLVHINIPSNRWYFHTQNAEKLGFIGRALTATVFKGEQRSHEQNLEAWGTYVDWTTTALRDAFKGIENLDKNLAQTLRRDLDKSLTLNEYDIQKNSLKKEIDGLVVDIYSCKELLKNSNVTSTEKSVLKEKIKAFEHELKAKRTELREILVNEYTDLGFREAFSAQLFESLKEHAETPELKAFKNALDAVGLMRQVLGAQLRMPGMQMSRGQEGMMIQLLNDRLGVHSAMNCKSGLDRTGFWHSVKLSMVRFEKENPTVDVVEFVENWDENTTLMNKLEARLNKEGGTLGDWFNDNPPVSLQKWVEKFGDLLPESCVEQTNTGPIVSREHMINFKNEMRRVAQFREMVLQNLLAVGIPITQISTGLVGLKWNSGMVENLHPLNFLPSEVDVGLDEKARLVNYNNDGSVKGITRWGRSLLTKFQNLRGS